MKRLLKRAFPLLMGIILAFPTALYGAVDERIFTDPVVGAYQGVPDAVQIQNNLRFNDVPADHWAAESIVRAGSLNLVKGDNGNYFPGNFVTNEEALAFILRVMNMEGRAIDEANRVRGDFNEDETTRNLWSIGYISLARNLGLITAEDYNSLTADTDGTVEASGLVRTDPATRERVAMWLANGINTVADGTLPLNNDIQAAMNFNDWGDIDIGSLQAVEALARENIMMGDNNGNFNPKSGLTRAEMAQIIRNMDYIYYNMYNISKKSGTVGGIRDSVSSETGAANLTKDYYVRVADGTVDTLSYIYTENNPGRNMSGIAVMDAVVFKNGAVSGLSALVEGDQIEYLVDNTTGEVLYVETLSTGPTVSEIEGKLYSVDLETGSVVIENENGIKQEYNMMSGVYGEDFVVIDQKNNDEGSMPLGSNVKLRLLNEAIESVSFIGNPVLIQETRGIVVENNPDFGYITFVDNTGQMVTKNYYADSITVEKQKYYDADDEIGYIDEVFPNFEYDAKDTYIEDIEAGDIIFVRYNPEDLSIIDNISASTNYVAKYGKISQITRGEGISRYLVEYENNQTSWFDVADNIFVSRVGRPVAHGDVKVGDWAKFLVNQAIIQPGYMVESIKEINIEGEEHFVSNIVKGQLAGIEPIQRQLIVQNAQVLNKTGWSDYKNLQQINIASNDIEYYYNGERISLDYAERYLKRADGEVYIAMENAASGERARMITFRMGRDELLNADTIITSDGSGTFSMLSNAGDITTDTGTIVRRNGRLVSNNNILPSDYSVVSLNGGNTAAVVDISDAPGIENVYIARGRILSVDQGENFKVQSMSVLS
ncbi:MAG: S-layer homology domain-containing protein, partial [Clostridiales bacterium]|nr:S-layer homology domain-containing protein [Clostridiales bacterium]